ncbi:MAG: hypothetical protein Tsb0020_27780 [Haliangiales bacterium]
MTRTETRMQRTSQGTDGESNIVGLWVLLVINEGQLSTEDENARVPMMARAGNDQTFLLGFKNMVKARQFMSSSEVEHAEPRMVVKSNKSEVIEIARNAGVVGILVDYDPITQEYASATELC